MHTTSLGSTTRVMTSVINGCDLGHRATERAGGGVSSPSSASPAKPRSRCAPATAACWVNKNPDLLRNELCDFHSGNS